MFKNLNVASRECQYLDGEVTKHDAQRREQRRRDRPRNRGFRNISEPQTGDRGPGTPPRTGQLAAQHRGNPYKADGYSYSTAKNQMNRLDLFGPGKLDRRLETRNGVVPQAVAG